MKGILLAGGLGTRLYPLTLATSKQLLPVYDKPLIYYPLSVLMQAGIREILIISTREDLPRFQALFGDGTHLGLTIAYAIQMAPKGIAEAFLIGEKFIGAGSVSLILGDNIFYGHALPQLLSTCQHLQKGALVFGYEVADPTRYGVVRFDDQMRPIEIVEKPKAPSSPYAVTGLYFYDNDVISIARSLKPSPRGELEITDVSNAYLKRGDLKVRLLDRGSAWLDAGTPESLQKASSYVQAVQEQQGIKIGCIEEIAYRLGYITEEELLRIIAPIAKSDYGKYLEKILSPQRKGTTKKIIHLI